MPKKEMVAKVPDLPHGSAPHATCLSQSKLRRICHGGLSLCVGLGICFLSGTGSALLLAGSARGQETVPPVQPPTRGETGRGFGATGDPFGSTGGTGGGAAAVAEPSRAPVATQPSANVIGGAEASARAASDAGDLFGKSLSAVGVIIQHRSPIVSDPRIRGYHYGQIITNLNGAFTFPARIDLDTIVSGINANSIQNVIILKGPYSVRYGYGPGFAFLDVETLPVQRFADGLEGHGSTSLTYKTNGQQWRGQQMLWGGSTDWGVRLGYDIATGVDYDSGVGVQIPSGYKSQNFDFAFGYNFSPDCRLDFRAMRLNQADVELPGQVFDISRLLSDNYTARFVMENQDCFDRFTIDAWHTYTRFDGNDLSPSKAQQIPVLNNLPIPTGPDGISDQFLIRPGFTGPFRLIAFTDGDVVTPGFRTAMTWGKEKDHQFTLGVDLRYISQKLNEFDFFTGLQPFFSGNNPIPRSHSVNPGFFLDDVLPINDRLTLKTGFRADMVSTDVDSLPTRLSSSSPAGATLSDVLGTNDFSNQYDLWSLFLTGEYKMTDNVTLLGGLGLAQRAPTPTELYAAGPFLAVIQNGLNSVVGNPRLAPEQAWQIDLGVRAEYERLRVGGNLFYSWIHNYITFEELQPVPFNTIKFVNTDQATLSGVELYGEYDANRWLTPFATMSFVEGRDKTRDQRGSTLVNPVPGSFSPEEPLPGIPPLETRLGLRVHQAGRTPRWAMEVTARVVAAQDRVAQSLREVATPGFTVWNFRSYWKPTDQLLLLAGVENFGDKNYQEHLDLRTGRGVFEPGINFYFGARVEY